MSYTLTTVLVSLSLPAIALAIIVGMERRGKKLQEDSAAGVPDTGPASKLQNPALTETVAKTVLQEPQYRERAG